MSRYKFGYGYGEHELPDGFKERLSAAFKAIRKRGFIAKQNFLCCGGCASGQIYSDFCKLHNSNNKKAEATIGFVFYHRQNTSDLMNNRCKGFHLAYGSLEIQDKVITKISMKEAGVIVTEELSKQGIKFEWNGDPDKKIMVLKELVN